jgi:methylated-DNA-[protein]-cysteine S-methyltransferase
MTDPNAMAFLALDEADNTTLDRLHDRLVDVASTERMLDVAYRTVDSPLGPLLLAATEAGVVRLAYELQNHDQVLQALALQVSPRVLHAPARLDEVARQLEGYFTGRRRSFDLPLDLRLSTGFRRQVLDHMRTIAYGHTESYSGVARATGRARAVRAVGSACATNPLPLLVPCHRVLRSDGSLGGYVGGLRAKQALLALER